MKTSNGVADMERRDADAVREDGRERLAAAWEALASERDNEAVLFRRVAEKLRTGGLGRRPVLRMCG